MNDSPDTLKTLRQEVETLKGKLAEMQKHLNEMEETLQAIGSGEIDALVVSTQQGKRVFILEGVDYVYQCLVEQMGEGASTISDDGLILYANQQLSELLNCPSKNLIGSRLETFISTHDKKAFLLLLQQLQEQKTLSQELSLIPATKNQEIPVKLSLKQFRVNEVVVNSIIITDLTELKVEAAKLNQVLNTTIAVIVSYRVFPDHTWIFDYWSQGCEQLFGYTAAELMADQNLFTSRIFPEDLETFISQTFEDYKLNRTSYIEYRYHHKNGNVHWILSSQLFQWDETDNCWNVTGFLVDITQRKQAQQKIIEQATLIDLTTDAIFVQDLDNQILFWSKGAERLYGWTEAEVLGQKTSTLFNQVNEITKAVQTTIEQGSYQGELEQITKEGTKIIVESRRTLVDNLFSQPQSILVVNSDITEKKQLEKQFYHIQRLESLGTLASGISHDFNNILTPILAGSQLLTLQFPNLDDQTKKLLTLLYDNAKRGADLVKQILLFSRDTEGQSVVLQLGYLLLELIGITQQTFPKSITILSEIPTIKLWTISADATQIHQVFMNLLVNARDAMSEGGTLTITAENCQIDQYHTQMNLEAKAGAYVMVTVADTGIGIPPDLLERIFDPFFTTKGTGKGTGLGLSTVRGIVKKHGGFVNVYSQLGQGTEFKVFFPAIEGKVSVKTEAKEMPRGKGELILIVDDEVSIREINQTYLENYNYRVILASDGIEAVDLYGKHQQEISVVLMDMMMPNLDGIAAIHTLKSINPLVKIIGTSGLITNSQVDLKADVHTFLTKPYTLKQLLQILQEILSSDNDKREGIPTIISEDPSPRLTVELSKEDLAIMPPEWLQQMYDAAYYCDEDLLLELIEQIPVSQEAIANTLQDLVMDFNMDLIMELTK